MFSALLLASAIALSYAAAPVPWSQTVQITYDVGQAGAQYNGAVSLPVFESDLTVEVQGTNLTWAFQLCLKLHVASPAVAGSQNWNNTRYCNLYSFGGASGYKRAVFSNGELRGFGADAHASHAEHAAVQRRSLGAWQQSNNVVAGHFMLTVSAATAPSTNTTITLVLSSTTCAVANHFGPNCETPAQITPGVAQTVTTAAHAITLLELASNVGNINATTGALVVQVDKVGTTAGTVYARFSAPSTATSFDLSAPLTNASTILTVPSPRQGTWFFSIGNGDNTTALVTNVTVTVKQCGTTFGPDCSISPAAIGTAGAVVDFQNLTMGAVTYFRFPANATLAIAAVADDATQHSPSLYAKLGSLPTVNDFDVVDCSVSSCTAPQNTLIVPQDAVWSGMAGSEWFVMVKSNDVGGVSVWNANGCANNCTSTTAGTCNAATSTCACTSDFQSFDCSQAKNQLERWEWALIMGGGVLVAIGLIGCIVYFIQKQQRRKGFERV